MATDFLPARDADLDLWLSNFKALVASNPSAYGLTAADATSVTNSYAAWHAAFLTATNPATRTSITVAAKDAQRGLTITLVRALAASVRNNASVSETLKLGLGLRVRDGSVSPVPPPASRPLLAIRGGSHGSQTLNAADQSSPTRRARPKGTVGLLVFRAVGATPTHNPESAAFLGLVTRAEFLSTFASDDDGKIATYFARWTNAKGDLGPWSAPVSMRIAA